MMKARTSLWASLAIAASVGLAGCGGSNDNGDETNPPAEPSTPAKTAMSEEIELSDAQAAALLAVLPDTGNSVELKGGGERAGVTFACTSADPCTITIENSAGTIVATAHSTTSGEVAGTAAGLEPPAIPAVSGASADILEGEIGTSTASGIVGGGTHLEVAGFGAVDGDDAARELDLSDPKDFTQSDDAPAALDGWTGEIWTTGNQIVVRYTNQNVQTVTDGTFRSQYGDKDGGNSDEITSEDSAVFDWKHAESDDLPTGAKVEQFQQDVSFAGTYAEVEGKFSCTGGTCTLALDKDGKIVEGANSVWKFKADDETSAVSYEKADADYLAFGWWRKSVGSNHVGVAVDGFRVLHAGNYSTPYDPGGVTGKATYNGHAAGNYVEGAEETKDREGGEFVADVKLEAVFGAAPTDGTSTITGTISKFRDSSGTPLSGWEVVAKNAADEALAANFTFSGNHGGTAAGKAWAASGGGGSFHGPSANDEQASGVTGWFTASTVSSFGELDSEDDVAVAGAFAATR